MTAYSLSVQLWCSELRHELPILRPKDEQKRYHNPHLPINIRRLFLDGVWMEKMTSQRFQYSEMETTCDM